MYKYIHDLFDPDSAQVIINVTFEVIQRFETYSEHVNQPHLIKLRILEMII
jgi:hypothetical protein